MGLITWGDDRLLGIDSLDKQHKMRDAGYPGYTAHVREHVMLIAELKSSFAEALTQQ